MNTKQHNQMVSIIGSCGDDKLATIIENNGTMMQEFTAVLAHLLTVQAETDKMVKGWLAAYGDEALVVLRAASKMYPILKPFLPVDEEKANQKMKGKPAKKKVTKADQAVKTAASFDKTIEKHGLTREMIMEQWGYDMGLSK